MVFVLFAAEWWRREYNGGAWSWEEIFNRIGSTRDDLPVSYRNDAIETGLRYWGREVRIGDHHREFLASIALEGGLPLRRLRVHGHGHGELLKAIIRDLSERERFGLTGEDIARLNGVKLPVTFRRDEVYSVLGKIAEACIDLRKEYNLSDQADPVSWLNLNAPDWKQRFPLNLSDDGADILLKALIEEASRFDESGATSFEIRRYLLSSKGGFHLKAELHLPEKKINEEAVQQLIQKHGQGVLTSRINIFISANNTVQVAARLRAMAGKNSYRVRKQDIAFRENAAAAEIRLRFEDGMKGKICEFTPQNGSELDRDLPWVFTDFSDDSPCIMLSQGRARLKDESCIIVIPVGLVIDDSDGLCELIGSIAVLNREIFRVTGNVKLELQDGPIWIKTEQSQIEIAEYEIEGKTLEWESSPKSIFIGSPKVFERKLNTTPRMLHSDKLVWRWFGQNEVWRKGQPLPIAGVIELAGIDDKTSSKT